MNIGKIQGSVLKRSVFRQLKTKRKEVLSGAEPGEDCAILSFPPDEELLVSSAAAVKTGHDAVLYGIHTAVNNIAACGGRPAAIWLTVLLPPEAEEENLKALMKQADQICAGMDIQIAGGHTEVTSAVKRAVVSVTAAGTVSPGQGIRTSGLYPGAELVVTKWIGWQQGEVCRDEGLDPLWIFNHFHFLDSAREGKRPLTFSRYAGPGSHRYPIGFSGDTIVTWESLDFQPYFTLTASNIGYGWWSHDIGGHMLGYKDDEMTVRWVQLGIYSPIMRLHSSSSEFNGKEPWRYKKEAEMVMDHMLRERHRMIPYLYTMNYRSYCENKPLISPMYYNWQECNEAYEKKNQYLFGTSLMVAPITAPRIEKINMAKVQAWLPKGRWYDIYTGMIYDGDRILDLYRGIESIPVFASAGSILAFTDEISAVQAQKNPNSLHLMVYAGQNGEFELYEDDNVSCAYEERICCTTKMVYCEDEKPIFTIYPSAGNRDLIPQKRSYTVEMTGFENSGETVVVRKNGVGTDAQISYDRWKKAIVVEIPETETDAMIEVSLEHTASGARNDVVERCFDFLNQAEIEFVQKDRLYELIRSERPAAGILSELFAMDISRDLRGVLVEILTAQIV